MSRIATLLCAAALLAGCKPDFGQPASLVTAPRLLAVRATPPEASPGAPVVFDVLAAGPTGAPADVAIDWAYCGSPKPLNDNNVVGPECLRGEGIRPLPGPSATLSAPLPVDACLLFGPDTPPQQPGQPPLRPRDPDSTGGYYQPLRLYFDGEAAIALARVQCNLAQATGELARQYREQYQPNQNPRLRALDLSETAPRAGAKVTLTASWDAADAETYLYYDVAAQTLGQRREALRVSWFATAGSFEHEVTGRGEDETATTTANGWTAPLQAGTVYVWAVLRDSRGGVDFRGLTVNVGP